MAKKRGKSVSFDAMVKFFLQTYDIPSKKDVDKLIAKMDNMEKLVKTLAASGTSRRVSGNAKASKSGPSISASAMALEIIKRFKNGVGFAEIQDRTGFEDKKLRNIIFRLNRLGKIKCKSRGVYIAL